MVHGSVKIFKLMVTAKRPKVKLRPHYYIAHLQPPSNVPTKCQILIPYGFRDIARLRLHTSRSLPHGQIKVTT